MHALTARIAERITRLCERRALDAERLEHLCRYLLRPPLADRRLRLLPADQVALELKTPSRDGTRWLTMSAETFLERLCSLVPVRCSLQGYGMPIGHDGPR